LLRAGYGDYVVNKEAVAYMRARALAGPVIALLREHPDRWFADRAAWNAHLDRLGISPLKVLPDPVLIATEGALWGSVNGRGSTGRRHAVLASLPEGRHGGGPVRAPTRSLFTTLDLVFMDTTSLYFEGAGGQTLSRHGFSKDHRSDLNQMILAVLLDGDGPPVFTEMWPGNTADVSSLIPVADRLRKRFSITVSASSPTAG
jgi:hypothetical protein